MLLSVAGPRRPASVVRSARTLGVSLNRITVLADIAGRPTRRVLGNARVTAAAVALPTSALDSLRASIPEDLGKWKSIEGPKAREVARWLVEHAVAVGCATVNRDTPAWTRALRDEEVLHSEIAAESRRKAERPVGQSFQSSLLMTCSVEPPFSPWHTSCASIGRRVW
jgi:hypothetical protein